MEQSSSSVSDLVGGDEPELIHGGVVLEPVHGGVLELAHGGDVPEPAHGGALILDGDVPDLVHGGVLVLESEPLHGVDESELVRGVAGAGLLLVVVARACPSRDILLPSS